MKSEKQFHELIEQQDTANKEQSLNALKSRLPYYSEANIKINNSNSTASVIKTKRFLISVISFAVILVVLLVVLLTVRLKDNAEDIRFCSSEDYIIVDSEQSIKEYSDQYNKNWLYFDWYDETDYYYDAIFILNDTNEVVCFKEEIIDVEYGYNITLRITDNRTELDILEVFRTCWESETISDMKITWGGGTFFSYAWFEYNGFKYYLEILEPESKDTSLYFVELLLAEV